MSTFSDADAVANYTDKPKRLVPGFLDMQRMAALILTESVPQDAKILVLGAGGGLELKVFAEHALGWTFTGVDPSAEMLDLACKTLGKHNPRVGLINGYITDAPDGPFDAAVCILTLHFLDKNTRLTALKEMRKRMIKGAPLIVAHHSFPQDPAEKDMWLNRYAAFAFASGVPTENAYAASKAIGEKLPAKFPSDDEDLIQQAGFSAPQLFYAGFTFRGWVAHKT